MVDYKEQEYIIPAFRFFVYKLYFHGSYFFKVKVHVKMRHLRHLPASGLLFQGYCSQKLSFVIN